MRTLTAKLRDALRDERGFTLIELIVATMAGIIVAAATSAVVIASVHFSSNYTDRVDANQEGRVAMEKITQALNSSCVATGVTPLVGSPAPTGMVGGAASGSDASDAVFYSSLSDSPTIGARDDQPSLVEIYLSAQQLVETPTPIRTAPEPRLNPGRSRRRRPRRTSCCCPTRPTPTIDGATVRPPVFQYYGYTSGGSINPIAFTTPLSTTDASNTAEVTVSFEALPSNKGANLSAKGAGANISDSVVLKLTPASSAPNGSNTPCT